MTLEPYSKFAPTGFDRPGAFLGDDRRSWFVAPVGTNRDADTLTRSNWAEQIELIPEGDDAEIHRFGHWACGWFEILIVRPDSDAHRKALEIADRLEDYPVLNDDRLSAMESEESFDSFSVHNIGDERENMSARAWDLLSTLDKGALWDILAPYHESDHDGWARFYITDRDQIAAILWAARKASRQ